MVVTWLFLHVVFLLLLAYFSGYASVLQMDLLEENSLQKYIISYFNIQFFIPLIPHTRYIQCSGGL